VLSSKLKLKKRVIKSCSNNFKYIPMTLETAVKVIPQSTFLHTQPIDPGIQTILPMETLASPTVQFQIASINEKRNKAYAQRSITKYHSSITSPTFTVPYLTPMVSLFTESTKLIAEQQILRTEPTIQQPRIFSLGNAVNNSYRKKPPTRKARLLHDVKNSFAFTRKRNITTYDWK
jgi:hypothetical protein